MEKFKNPIRIAGLMVLILSVCLIAFWIGCQQVSESPTGPSSLQEIVYDLSNPEIQKAVTVQVKNTADLIAKPDIIGTAVGLTDDGRPAILVFTTRRTLEKGVVAEEFENIPVIVEYTDIVRPMKGKPPKPGDEVDHKAKQTPPIKLGTSGGWKFDLANGYCCGGTLGSLVQGGGKLYILSNYHVFYGDQSANPDTPVIQPGLIDVGCIAGNAQDVAYLAGNRSLPNSNVDAAIAEIIPGMVNTSGEILEIGTLSSNTVAAYIGQKVKKSGRTTGLTRSSVTGLNATIQVQYDTECAGEAWFVKVFTGQILIKNRGSKFLAGGDSGSLMVENLSTNPRAVGLLFAGSSQIAVANPIDEVLDYFNVSMVGN